ncbi:hypothetical protein [Halosimplex sp. TS25]|uniref:hypothetical protein n=1 Tax=Halosimplex rarum TaxID=3396619 RepID=UPI0039EBD261
MTALDRRSREFHESLQEQYLEKLRSAGIRDTHEYFDRLGELNDGRVDPDAIELLREGEIPLTAFYRVAPTVDQEVMIATLNPGMQNNIDRSRLSDGGEYDRHARAGKDVEATAQSVARNQNGFFTHSDNRFDTLIQSLRSELDLLGDEQSYQEYVTPDGDNSLMDGFFGDICYTWVYKLATGDKTGIEDLARPDSEFARKKFVREVFDIVRPRVLVCVGKEGWRAIYEELELRGDPEELLKVYSDKSPLTKSYHPKLEKGAYSGLYRLPSEDLWIVTTWHASYWVKRERLRENLRLLNREIQ